MRAWKLTPRLALGLGLLLSVIFAPERARAVPLTGSPFTITDTSGGFVSLVPFGGNPQVDFAPIGGGILNFIFTLGAIDADLVQGGLYLRVDFGTLGNNTMFVNVVGPNQTGVSNEGLLLSGTLPMFNTTTWSLDLGTNPGPISMTYFSDIVLPNDVVAQLAIEQTPIPAALPLFAGGLGLIGLLSRRRRAARAA